MSGLASLLALSLISGAQSSAGDCPSEADVRAELHALDLSTGGNAFSVEDFGERYRVTLASGSRELEDPIRDCHERARAAAVLVALQHPPVGAVRKPAELVSAPEGRRLALQLETALIAGFMLRAGADASPGFGVRVALGSSPVSLVLGAGMTMPARLRLSNATAVITRAPLELSVRLWRVGERLSLGAELGVSSAVLWVRGDGLEGVHTALRMDFGLRAASLLQLRLWRQGGLGLPVGITYFPRPHSLEVSGLGAVGTLPSLRLDVGLSGWWSFQ